MLAAGLLSTTMLSGQQTQNSAPQTGQPAQPSSSVYGRMRRAPVAQGQQPTTQAQQFPSPAQQFPPDQTAPASPGQRPPTRFPHAEQPMPPAQASSQVQIPGQPAPQSQPQPGITQQPGTSQPAVQQPQPPSGAEQQPPNPPRVSFVGGFGGFCSASATVRGGTKAAESTHEACARRIRRLLFRP